MDLFGKKSDKFSVVLHKKPSELSQGEGAVYLLMAAALAEAKKFGVDPTKVHLVLEFQETGHKMCLNLANDGSGLRSGTCEN